MGCGILYRMVAERIKLSATLATRRTMCYLSLLLTRSRENDDVVCGARSCPSWMQGPTKRADGKGVSRESPPMG
jgi:hypothetical protein